MLKGLGYDPGRTDGYFNQDTEEAVKSFQKEHELKATGKVNDKTAGKIETEIVEHIRSGEDDQQMEKALNELYQ